MPAAHAAPQTLLIFGDSLSTGYGLTRGTGWVDLLAQRVERNNYPWRVVNASISGETTAGGATRLPTVLRQHRPAIVIIELGGNDGLRGLPIDAMRSNLDRMIKTATRAGARPILVGMRLPPNYGIQYTTKFHDTFRTLAQRYGIVLVPFLLERVAARADLFQLDMIHPTAPAQPLVLEEVWAYLEPLLRAQKRAATPKTDRVGPGKRAAPRSPARSEVLTESRYRDA